MRRKTLFYWLTAVACLITLLGEPGISRAGLFTGLMQRISSTQEQYRSISRQKEQTAASLKQLHSRAVQIEQQLDAINGELTAQDREIATGEAALAGLQKKIRQKQSAVAATTQQLQQKQQLMDQMLLDIYRNGPTSYLDVLLGAQNFFDFITRLEYVKQIVAFDRSVVDGLARVQAELVAEKQSLVNEQNAARSNLAYLERLKAGRLAEQKQKQILLASLRQQENHEINELQAENRAMQYMAEQIAALERQYSVGNTPAPSGGWVWPVPSSHVITSGYGWRTILGSREFHDGIDIAAPVGAPIVAAADGVVLYAGPAEGFGHWIVIEHANHLLSVYGHMYANEILVHPGEHVTAGQEIAEVGADGFATGPHLHFSVITGFDSSGRMISVNPLNYI